MRSLERTLETLRRNQDDFEVSIELKMEKDSVVLGVYCNDLAAISHIPLKRLKGQDFDLLDHKAETEVCGIISRWLKERKDGKGSPNH